MFDYKFNILKETSLTKTIIFMATKLGKARDKVRRFLSANHIGYTQNRVPDYILAQQLYKLINGRFKRFNEEQAQKYIKGFTNKESAVYAIGNMDEGYAKIGYTTDIENRLKTIQTSCPFKVRVIKLWIGLTRKHERFLHREYDRYNTHGEWFEIKGKLKHELKK